MTTQRILNSQLNKTRRVSVKQETTKRNETAPQCKPRPKLSCHSYLLYSTVPAAAWQVHPNNWNFVRADVRSDYIRLQDKTSLRTQAFPSTLGTRLSLPNNLYHVCASFVRERDYTRYNTVRWSRAQTPPSRRGKGVWLQYDIPLEGRNQHTTVSDHVLTYAI